MYLIAFGFISPLAITSLTIANQVMGLIWFANGGISAAAAIMLGHKLGENKLAEAKDYARRFVRINLVVGITVGLILFALSRPIALTYSATSDAVKDNVVLFLRIYAVYLPVKFMNAMHIVGTLRSGGDTVYALMSELLPLWGYGVPVVFILALTTTLPLYLILILINVEELIKLALLWRRYQTDKWIKNLTLDEKVLTS
jgi:Na+-driven multidrug efflux pump